MGQCFLHGNGGANPLNFKVVGNPQPTNPKENTIWIDTVTKITSWFFSAKEPKLVSATKNVLNLKDGKTVTNGGVTYTNNGDGTYSRKGTASDVNGNAWLWGGYNVAPAEDESNVLVTLECGKTYFASDCVVFSFENGSGYSFRGLFTVDPAVFKDGLKITGVRNPVHEVGKVYSDTVYPMICEGSEAGEWEPFDATGQIWISTGASGNVEFNALKKNGIQVYPISAKQYINNAWVDKEAKIYQNSAWEDFWDGTLFYQGNQYTNVTGGWEKKSGVHVADRANTGYVTIASTLKTDSATGSACSAIATTKNPIDLTNVTSITIVVDAVDKNQFLGVHTAESGEIRGQASKEITSKGTYSLDVSSLSGKHYISIGGNGSSSMTTSKVKLNFEVI